jgi:protein TonB
MQSKLPFVLLLLVVSARAEGQRPAGGAPVRQGGTWHLTASPAESTAQASATLELEALDMVRGPIVDFRPALYLRCHNETLEAFVMTGAGADRGSDYRTTVRLRWGDQPPVVETWRRSTDFAAVFAPAPAAFIRRLVSTPELTLEVRAHDGPPITARFNGAGLDAYLPRLTSGCRGARTDSVYAESDVDGKAELLSVPKAEYPPILRRAGIHGTVIVHLVVDTVGRVEPGSLRVVSSPNPMFNEPALDALRHAVFRPARLHGRAVRVRVRLPIEFTEPSR